MADENDAPKMDVNNQPAPEASSTSGAQDAAASPPASEITGSEQASDKRVPYPRFSEVVEERNRERKMREAYESRIRELETRVPSSTQPKPDHMATEIKRLQEKLGLKEDAARELAESTQNIARAEKADIEVRLRQYEIGEWNRSLQNKHKDYTEHVPAMEKLFSEMSPQEQQLVVASPRGLEMLYRQAKAEKADLAAQEAFEKGKDAAYQTKQDKRAVSPTPGVAPKAGSKLTREMIRNMSTEEYKKRLPEINLALQKGEIA